MLTTLLFLSLNIQPASPGIPNRQPQLAAAHGLVALTFASGQAIYFAASKDAGRTFETPAKVADVPAVAVGRHRGPRPVILKDAILVSAVVGAPSSDAHSHGLPADGDLVTWRSTDGGKNWSRAGIVNDEHGAAREGLHAMAADASGNLFAAWLDLRAKGTRLYGARSTDGGRSWSRNVLIYASPDGTICQCCDPSLAIDERGRVAVMWRNALDGSRDLYLSSSQDGSRFSSPQKLGVGTWKLDACPMDGGGLAWDRGELISAWRRDGQVFLARPGKPEIPVGAGKDVAIAAGRNGVFVAWTGSSGIEILAPGATRPQPLAPHGAFVSLVALEDGSVLAAWESGDEIRTARLGP